MPDSESRSTFWNRVLLVSGLLVLVVGLTLTFTGAGAKLRKEREVIVTVSVAEVDPPIAEHVKVGDPILTDFAGVPVGEVTEVDVRPMPITVKDAEGGVHLRPDPVKDQLTFKIRSRARVGDDFIAIGGQTLLAGQDTVLISRFWRFYARVVDIDVL